MNEKNTGGPAFPEIGNVGHNSDWQNESGMSLRDYFAGQALLEWSGTVDLAAGNEHEQMRTIARICFGFADAMIEVRDE